jgi:hypothetical protein
MEKMQSWRNDPAMRDEAANVRSLATAGVAD